MLHLAQVIKSHCVNELELQQLACETQRNCWQKESGKFYPETLEEFNEGSLVLVEVDENQQIVKIESAKDWIVNIVLQSFNESRLTAEFIEQEEARIEQWRQQMTTKNLELTRRQLEIETQREQIQAIEESLAKSL